ncbi:MAG: thioredoxin family protein [Myxococcota bacterium]
MPDIEELAAEFAGQVRFVKVDVDKDEEVRAEFGIGGIPSYLVFKDGREVDRIRVRQLPFLLKWRIRRMVKTALE